MRRSIAFLLLAVLVLLVLAVRSVWTLIELLFEDGEADAIAIGSLERSNTTGQDHAELPAEVIPRIIHQTFANDSIPERWREPFQQCRDQHGEDYDYKFWTDASGRDFIATQYPSFLATYDAYPYPIQRADVLRYFLLFHHGGSYVDLDDGCNRRLDPLNQFPAWLHRTDPTGVSNDAMGARAGHPFLKFVIDALPAYDRNWGLPYVTVMASTGPLFLSVMWRRWIVSGQNTGDGIDGGRVRVLREADYHQHPWSFFNTFGGSTWHESDARFFLWLSEHGLALSAAGGALALLLLGYLGLRYSKRRRQRHASDIAYTRLSHSPVRDADRDRARAREQRRDRSWDGNHNLHESHEMHRAGSPWRSDAYSHNGTAPRREAGEQSRSLSRLLPWRQSGRSRSRDAAARRLA